LKPATEASGQHALCPYPPPPLPPPAPARAHPTELKRTGLQGGDEQCNLRLTNAEGALFCRAHMYQYLVAVLVHMGEAREQTPSATTDCMCAYVAPINRALRWCLGFAFSLTRLTCSRLRSGAQVHAGTRQTPSSSGPRQAEERSTQPKFAVDSASGATNGTGCAWLMSTRPGLCGDRAVRVSYTAHDL
jgi:hypothetical protein